MARVFANNAFDQSDLDLSRLYYNSRDYGLFDNVRAQYNGVTYNDVYVVDWMVGGNYMASAFAGGYLSVDGRQQINGGTVNGYLELAWNGSSYTELYGIDGISVSAVDLYNAATTRYTNDELSIISTALAGSDLFDLSNYRDVAAGYDGNDRMYGRGGNDALFGGNGHDQLFGESGNDYLNGGSGNELLNGGSGHDRLDGGTGNDRLLGGTGNEVLKGGAGRDILQGGTGRDKLYAGNDVDTDTFVFAAVRDSRIGGNKRDKLYQFDSGEDVIDLSRMDANTRVGGNQEFDYSDYAAANSVWVVDIGRHLLVRGDVNGDGRADFEIQVMSTNSLTQDDFIL